MQMGQKKIRTMRDNRQDEKWKNKIKRGRIEMRKDTKEETGDKRERR